LQTKTDGVLNMLIVDFDAPSNLRALARFDADKLSQREEPGVPAICWARSSRLHHRSGRWSVALSRRHRAGRAGLEEAAHQYFQRSEQIPTLVRLAVGENLTSTGAHWRAGGVIVQFLPDSPGRRRQADLDPGDAPPGAPRDVVADDDPGPRPKPRGDHRGSRTDRSTLSSERLLYRLFHERGVRVFEPGVLRDACRCSSERIDAMLQSFTAAERADMIGDDGKIGVTCEFCSTKRIFDPADYG